MKMKSPLIRLSLFLIAMALCACNGGLGEPRGEAALQEVQLANPPLVENHAALRETTHAEAASPEANVQDSCVANLPFARGQTFCCLDDYLAHLEVQGAIDLPWWRQISPGVYEHITRMTGAQPEIATRAELMTRFGFSC